MEGANGDTAGRLKRSPVIAVLGHVDHGKTSLLDRIRKTKVAEREAGGITQSTGAYEITHAVEGSGGPRRITFIDTPGHEAFRAMRMRGASVADLAILVVAADEGVKPQTVESIAILRETATPFVVALTKIDKPSANVERAKGDLASAGVFLEGAGGDVSWQGVSAKTGEGIDTLLDLVLLATDVLDLSYSPSGAPTGFVIESHKESRRGVVASVVLKDGTLRRGSDIATLSAQGRVRILENFAGRAVEELVPSSPALIFGFEDLPRVGEAFSAGDGALEAVRALSGAMRRADPVGVGFAPADGAPKAFLKADVLGALEVLQELVRGKVTVVEASAGEITDGDVKHASVTGACIVAFRTGFQRGAEQFARDRKVTVFMSNIIYELMELLEKHLDSLKVPELSGRLQVLALFGEPRGDEQVVGGRVVAGVIQRKKRVQISRRGISIGEGRVLNLQKSKEDAQEVQEGEECGLLVDSGVIIKAGDELSQGAA